MPGPVFPLWTLLPFPALVLAIAIFPMLSASRWHERRYQLAVVALCSLPVVIYEATNGYWAQLGEGSRNYVSFVLTLGALFVTSGGVYLQAELAPTPRSNVTFLLLGAVLASLIGTTGASMLLIRPLLASNARRTARAHLVPFFILLVANVGGLLLPLGDPPLLVGYILGVPFFWTLHLFPVWLLYVASLLTAFYLVDRRAYRREPPSTFLGERRTVEAWSVRGRLNLVLLAAVAPAALLAPGMREVALLAITLLSLVATPKSLHEANGFGLGPLGEVAILFAGLFACLGPLEATLTVLAPRLPVQHAWQLFWGAGALSAVLDNAPTYTAFAALARGLPSHGSAVIAGIDPLRLAAISAGSVVMGATTYLGNGPNLMVKAIAERERYVMPSFGRYFVFALGAMLPAHLLVTAALCWLER